MLCMKKMIACHRLVCNIIGGVMGMGVGLLAANTLVNCCKPGRKMKKKAMKAFKAMEKTFCC